MSTDPPWRTRELRTTEQIRDIYQWKSVDAVRIWLRRHRVPMLRRGRVILSDLRDIDAVMKREAEEWERRRGKRRAIRRRG